MANEQSHIQPQEIAGSDQGVAAQGAVSSEVVAPTPVQPPMQPGLAGVAAGQSPGVAVPHGPDGPAMQPGVQTQGTTRCGCGGTQAHPGMPSVQQSALPANQGNAFVQHGPTLQQAASGYQQAGLSPAQRTAMMFGGGVQGSGHQQPAAAARWGVMPSQTTAPHPMPTDFITAQNSQLVYCIGELGYDFITDARRDYFVQQIRAMSENEKYIANFEKSLGLKPGPIYLPEDIRAMAAFLYQGAAADVALDPDGGPPPGPEEIGGMVWVLFQEGQPLYALRPLHTLALAVLATFANMLFDQARVTEEEEGVPNPKRSDRVSIAARIIGEITLYNGQTVPMLDASLRGLFNWRLELILDDVLGPKPGSDDEQANLEYAENRDRVANFLERIYYEVRNLGQTPQERAINYLATNAFQIKQAIVDAAKSKLELDSIYAEPSPICRPKSDCYDTIMRFFDPQNRLGRAIDEYRLTVDVNDVVPVGIGKLRHWARFA